LSKIESPTIIIKLTAKQGSNSQYAKTGSTYDEKAVDEMLPKAPRQVRDRLYGWPGGGASAPAESKTSC
jgi:hypothetical protein